MRQGRASPDGVAGRKVEPKPNRVSPVAVNQIGEALGDHATGVGKILNGTSVTLYQGRGFKAPYNQDLNGRPPGRNGGSQGRY